MIEIDVAALPAVADYSDSSGHYTIRTDREFLATVIRDHEGVVCDAFVYRLSLVQPHIEIGLDPAEWAQSERFGSSPDGPMGETVVWIDGVAYFAAWAEDAYLVGAEVGVA